MIETQKKLIPKLAKVLQDPDANVRKSALRLYELLNYQASLSHKVEYNKKILPLAIEIAKNDAKMEVRKQALSTLVGTRDERVIGTIVQMIGCLSEDEYKAIFTDNVWSGLSNSGLGTKFRKELFKEFVSNTDEDARRRIEEITEHRYLG